MNYYRVSYNGYIEGEFESEDDAREALISHIRNDEIDSLGRFWTDLIEIEKLD